LRAPLFLNSYAYVQNNPVNLRDSFGFEDEETELQKDQEVQQAELQALTSTVQALQSMLMQTPQNLLNGDAPSSGGNLSAALASGQTCPLPSSSGTRGLYVGIQQQQPQVQQAQQQLLQGMPVPNLGDPSTKGIYNPLLQQKLAIEQQLTQEALQFALESQMLVDLTTMGRATIQNSTNQ